MAWTKIRQSNTEANNQRLLIVHEVLYAIKLVKFYTWEESFAQKIINIRKGEIRQLVKVSFVKAVAIMIMVWHHVLAAIGVFYMQTLRKVKLTPMQSFTMVSSCNSFRFSLFYFPVAIKNIYEARHSIKRIERFLLEDDCNKVSEAIEYGVFFNKAVFTHRNALNSKVLETEKLQGKKLCEYAKKQFLKENSTPEFYLKNITFEVRRGECLALIGPFGSGKSSVAQAILGDSKLICGEIAVAGSIAYVPQTPWILHGSIRDNILFGKPFDRAWYLKVVRACCLLPDLRQMKEYDMTYLSEGGINLSGGQRQRIALARAVYSRADIYILDSVLSALDPETARVIFRRVVKEILKVSAVIMITHNLEAIPHCDKLLILEKGEVQFYGTYNQAAVIKAFPDSVESGDEKDVASSKPRSLSVAEPGDRILTRLLKASAFMEKSALETTEAQKDDTVPVASKVEEGNDVETRPVQMSLATALWKWSKYAGLVPFLLNSLLFPISQSIRVYMDFWVRYWLNDFFGKSDTWYVSLYFALFACFGILVFIRGIFHYLLGMRAAIRMHDSFFRSIVGAPMLFFSQEPLGSILKAYSQDQDQVDDGCPESMQSTLFWGSIVLCTIGSLCFVHKTFIPAYFILIAVWLFVQWWISKPTALCKDNVARTDSAAIVHASETLHGIAVVRAFGVEAVMARENEVSLASFI